MGFKIKNSLTGEFEKLPILTLKGEKGETGGVEEYNKVDYMGNKYETLKQANDANVEYAVKTAIGEFNYLDYDGQHITATDTIEGRSKSAILTGNTLVNLCKIPSEFVSINSSLISVDLDIAHNLQVNKKYAVIGEISEINAPNKGLCTWVTHADDTVSYDNKIVTNNGRFFFTYDVTKEIKTFRLYVHASDRDNGGSITIGNLMLIEYQDGMENWNIPYFEGMQSVKMPVLTTTGKNLLDINHFSKLENWDRKITAEKPYDAYEMKLKPNTSYTFSRKENSTANNIYFCFSKKQGVYDWYGGIIHPTDTSATYQQRTITTDSTGILYFNLYQAYKELANLIPLLEDAQLEEGSATTPYEPYKSNILSTPEDLELRGIGKVKDELNLLTGELTQRIGEVVLDGSEEWTFNRATINHNLWLTTIANPALNTSVRKNNMLCNKLIVEDFASFDDKDYEFISINNGNSKLIYLKLDKTKGSTLTELKNYLQSNPLTVQYQLATESIKTVDLSDNHVYSYKGTTHYDCSSAEGSLVPTLSVKVPTDVQAAIAQQRETIQTLNSENERLNQIQEALKASMLDSQVQLMNLSWDIDFEVFTLRESIAPKDSLLYSRTGSNIDKFSQAKFIIENDCPNLEKLNSQIEYYFRKDVFSQEQFEELTDLISIVKGENGCEY